MVGITGLSRCWSALFLRAFLCLWNFCIGIASLATDLLDWNFQVMEAEIQPLVLGKKLHLTNNSWIVVPTCQNNNNLAKVLVFTLSVAPIGLPIFSLNESKMDQTIDHKAIENSIKFIMTVLIDFPPILGGLESPSGGFAEHMLKLIGHLGVSGDHLGESGSGLGGVWRSSSRALHSLQTV